MDITADQPTRRRRDQLHTDLSIKDSGTDLVLQINIGTVLLSINQDDRSAPASSHFHAIGHEDRSPDDDAHARTGLAQETQRKPLVTDSSLCEKTRPGRDHRERPEKITHATSYHIFTTSICRRDSKNAQHAATLSVSHTPVVPR